MILPHLIKLTERGWWTVGSQPAVDGALSSDEVVGWGPRGGWVFQKAFAEFFVQSEAEVRTIEKKILEKGDGWVSFFAGDSDVSEITNLVVMGVMAEQDTFFMRV